jgi:acyl carrier protein
MTETERKLADIVLAVHRRNGGDLTELDFDLALLAPELGLDSMDLAEIMVAVEREFGVDPFGGDAPPRTWREVVR